MDHPQKEMKHLPTIENLKGYVTVGLPEGYTNSLVWTDGNSLIQDEAVGSVGCQVYHLEGLFLHLFGKIRSTLT